MKSQAETAGRLTRGSATHPQKGTVLRDPELLLADGTRRLLSALRGHSNLVMLFSAGHDVSGCVASLAGKAHALKENNGRVLVVVLEERESSSEASAAQLPQSIAIDLGGQVHRMLGATDPAGNPVPTIYITDRFGEVFAAFHGADPASLPDAQEIICWLDFINQQCEECSPPEWPE
jgi:hypothetical protein